MFIRGKSNRPKFSGIKKEAVPQEQPLDVAEIAVQKVEEVMNMVPVSIAVEEVEAFLNEDACEECAVAPVEPVGEAEPAQDLDDEVSSPEDGDITE